ETGLAKLVVEGRITHEIDGHALRISKQQHVTESGNLTIKRFNAESCGVKEFVHRVPVLAQTAVCNDARITQRDWIQLVLGNAAPPGLMNDGVAGRLLANGDPYKLIDMSGLFVPHDDEPSKIPLPPPLKCRADGLFDQAKSGGAKSRKIRWYTLGEASPRRS